MNSLERKTTTYKNHRIVLFAYNPSKIAYTVFVPKNNYPALESIKEFESEQRATDAAKAAIDRALKRGYY